MYADPSILTASTNRNLLQPTEDNRRRRKSQIKNLQESTAKGKQRDQSQNGESSRSKSAHSKSRVPLPSFLRQKSSSSSSAKSDKSQLVDLVVEDHHAEEIDRVRARKEGGPGWNEVPSKHFVYVSQSSAKHLSLTLPYSHTYPGEGEEEEVREGFNPDEPQPHNPESDHNMSYPFAVEEQTEDQQQKQGIKPPINTGAANHWETRDVGDAESREEDRGDRQSPSYGSFREERNAWNDD
jgi:hypothetical protein